MFRKCVFVGLLLCWFVVAVVVPVAFCFVAGHTGVGGTANTGAGYVLLQYIDFDVIEGYLVNVTVMSVHLEDVGDGGDVEFGIYDSELQEVWSSGAVSVEDDWEGWKNETVNIELVAGVYYLACSRADGDVECKYVISAGDDADYQSNSYPLPPSLVSVHWDAFAISMYIEYEYVELTDFASSGLGLFAYSVFYAVVLFIFGLVTLVTLKVGGWLLPVVLGLVDLVIVGLCLQDQYYELISFSPYPQLFVGAIAGIGLMVAVTRYRSGV